MGVSHRLRETRIIAESGILRKSYANQVVARPNVDKGAPGSFTKRDLTPFS